jgi:hypothetical protein
MLCQYSRCGLVSSEKDEMAAEAGEEEDKGEAGSILAATVLGGYRHLPKPTEVLSRAAKAAKALRSITPARLYLYDTILERLAQDLEPMAAKLGQFIQEEHAIVRQRHLARPRHVAAADQPHIRGAVMGA